MVYILAEIATTARLGNIRALDTLMEGYRLQQSSVFLKKAVQLYMDAKDSSQIQTVLYNSMIVSNFSGPQFLTATIITETMTALHDQEDLDYIFTFLIPSYFGVDFEDAAAQAYHDYRKHRLKQEMEKPSD